MKRRITAVIDRFKALQARTPRRLGDEKGFTLTEMLIVVAIIGLIGALVAQNVMGRFTRAKVDATKIQMRQLGAILDQYKLDCSFYPTTDQGLQALVEKPTGGRECRNYDPSGYVKGGKVPRDGFGFDFLYESDGRSYELVSLGADEREGGDAADSDISSKEID